MIEKLSRTVTLVVTNIIKLYGLKIGIQAVGTKPVDDVVLAYSAFLCAGAQFSETTVMRLIERFFGASDQDKKA